MEPHVFVCLPAILVSVKGSSGVLRFAALVLERDDRREERFEGWTETGCQGIGPNQSFILDDLQDATFVRKVLPLRRPHDEAEYSARTKIDLTIDGRPGHGSKPLLKVLWLSPDLPDEFTRHIDHAFQHQVQFRVHLVI